jgi:O-antigen/teichoic acid export membrane protein
MSTDRLIRNAVMAVAQVVVTGIVLFFLYRFLLQTLGAELVGVWSVVLAAASVSKIGELGFSGSALKYTTRYLASGEKQAAAQVVETTLITIGTTLALLLAAGYPLLAWLLAKIIPASHLTDAYAVLPYALASIWLTALAGIFLSALDGCHRIDRRARIIMIASLLLLLMTWLLVPVWGLIGMAWAQMVQGAGLLLMGWLALRHELPGLRMRWSGRLFREMFHYGFNFQVMSLFGLLVDPVSKALMAKFGGLSATAYYEMANRMVAQFRALLVAANQAVVPQVADLHERAPDEIGSLYRDAYRTIFFLSLPIYSGVIAIAPLASVVWIGSYEAQFVTYAALLVLAYWMNALAGPAYFVNLGTGHLRWCTLSTVVMALLNALLGAGLGLLLGGVGVALGAALAIIIASLLIVFDYHRRHRLRLLDLIPRESMPLFMVCCLSLASGLVLLQGMETELAGRMAAGGALVLGVILSVCWKHPLREKIQRRLLSAVHS